MVTSAGGLNAVDRGSASRSALLIVSLLEFPNSPVRLGVLRLAEPRSIGIGFASIGEMFALKSSGQRFQKN